MMRLDNGRNVHVKTCLLWVATIFKSLWVTRFRLHTLLLLEALMEWLLGALSRLFVGYAH